MISINKPKFDVRDFVGGTLDNGVKYVFVNDESLQKSFVSVTIHTGSFQNPKEYAGLAHFLEHMLFMGSNKYPNENHYNSRLNELGGYSNAYTDVMETVYYFNVFDDGLEEIIDIFSRFFIDPIFDSDAVNRELNAIDSEHQKNINNDTWRKYQFVLNLANTNNPINGFVTGSNESLNKKGIRDKVIEFYNNFYTANNISICISSSKNFDKLFEIIESTFGQIKKYTSTENNKLVIPKPSYSFNNGKSFHIKSISNKYEVSYMYEIPYQEKYLSSKEFTIFDMILTEKSENSLYFHLKKLGYLNSIYTEIRYEGVFTITLNLTKEGFSNMQYCEHLLFDTIKKISYLNINNIAKYFEKLLNVTFDCLNKFDTESLCNMLSVNHFYYNTINVFDGSFKIFKVNPTHEYTELFNKYINVNNLIKIIYSQEYYGMSHKYLKSQYYQTEYTELNLIFDDSYSHGDLIYFDTSNEYLNAEPNVIKNIDNYQIPTLIAEKQWYGACSQFGEPLVNIWLQLNNSNYFSTAKNYVLTQISCSILNFLVNTILYKPLQLCYNIYFDPSASLSCININISSLNDFSKVQLLLSQLREFIFNIDKHFNKIDERYTNNLIVSFNESYQNIKFSNPFEFSTYLVKSMVIQTEYSYDDLINQIKIITYQDIKSHITSLFDGASLTTLTYGNIQVKSVTNLFSQFSKLFYNSSSPLPQINNIQDVNISHPNPNEKSNCVSYFYKVGKFTPKDYSLLLILHKILGENFYDILRTKYQLGYITKLNMSVFRDDYYISERIQSAKPVELVKQKMNEFNENIEKFIKDSAFEKFIETINKELDEPDYSLSDKINRYRPEISLRTYLFNRNELVKEQLNKLTKQDVLQFAKQLFNDTNRKIVVINGNQ